ncbi:unnamed protein product [Symbiodinium sp. CCMP2592]|nr:unnamed protein product [Symbiodinium sp. CCMP2592]
MSQGMTVTVPHLPGFLVSSGLEYYRNPPTKRVLSASAPSPSSAVAQSAQQDVNKEWDSLIADIQAHLAKGRSDAALWVHELKLSKRYESCSKLRQRVKTAGGICKIIATMQFASAFNEARTWKFTYSYCDEHSWTPSTTTASTGSAIRTPECWPEYTPSQDRPA